MELKTLTDKNFNFLLDYSIKEYADFLFKFGEVMDPKRAFQISSKEVTKIVPDRLNTPNHFIYRLKDGHHSVGWLWYQILGDGKVAFLQYIHIDPTYRRKGYAEQALKCFEEDSDKKGAFAKELTVFIKNEPAVNLYKKTGYSIVQTVGFYEAKTVTRYRMTKRSPVTSKVG